MSIEGKAGPCISWGQLPPVVAGTAPPDYNPDTGPDMGYAGLGLLDNRYGFKIGGAGNPGSSPLLALGFFPGANYAVVDQVPSVASTTNIAAAADPVNGTPLTLVNATGAGVTVLAAPLFIPQTGITIPAGALCLDGPPGIVTFGENGAVGVADPTKALSRAVAIAAQAGSAGGNVLISGADLYGNPQTQIVVAAAGATVNSLKTFKFIYSITPQFTDAAHTLSAGIADVYGLPLRADNFGYVDATFNNAPVTAPTFVAADTTNPATNATGDVRGTIVVASDGTKRLQVMQGISPANALTTAGRFGVTPA